MKLEQQVVSLELAKKLKELGVTKESYFKWVTNGFPEGAAGRKWIVVRSQQFQEGFDAFTVAELGEMLPNEIRQKVGFWFNQAGMSHGWAVGYKSRVMGLLGNMEILEVSEADARARMLIYLLENNLLRK